MRIAALAFGILAGLVASFILALGGLDASELVHFDARQAQLVAFGLFVIANLGVLGAGLVLAAPIAGASLFVLGALGWLAAAIVLRHGPDYVMLTPPSLLAVAAILAGIAVFRRRRPAARPRAQRDEDDEDDDDDRYERRRAAPPRRAVPAVAPRRLADEVVDEPDDAGETDDRGSISVGASFFGDAGTAMPLRGAMPSHADEELLRGLGRGDRRSGDPHDWQPVRRRVEPPRQKPMFRSPEDEYEDEESGFSQFARISSGVLSFGLYATLAVAVLLVIFSLREGSGRATATRIEASASTPSAPLSSSAAPAAAAETPAIAPALPAVKLPSEPPSAPVLARPGGLAVPAAGAAAPVIATAPSVPAELRAPAAQPQPAPQQPFAYPGVVVADGPSLDGATEPPPALAPAPDDSASAATPADSQAATPATTPVPFPMPASIAAQRIGRSAAPAAQRSQPAPRAATGTDTGL